MISYSSGLTLATQTSTFINTGTLDACVGVGGESASATFGNSGTDNLSCLIQPNVTTTPAYTWADGVTSRLSLETITSLRPAGVSVITSADTVIEGRYESVTVARAVTITNFSDPTACLSPAGLTTASGPVTMTFVG